jgi:hypothetical protein
MYKRIAGNTLFKHKEIDMTQQHTTETAGIVVTEYATSDFEHITLETAPQPVCDPAEQADMTDTGNGNYRRIAAYTE